MQPAWALASVFFWSLFRPASLPAIGVCGWAAAGFAGAGAARGVWAVSLVVHAVALRLRRFLTRQGFALVWVAFAVFAAVASAAAWGLDSALMWRALPPWPALFACGMAVGAYPLLATLLTRAHRTLAAPEQA